MKIWLFLEENLTIFAAKSDEFCLDENYCDKKAHDLFGNKNQRILLQKSSSFPEKSSNVPEKTIRLSCENRLSSLENPLNFPVKIGGFS